MRSFLLEIAEFWKETWRSSKSLFLIEAVSTVLGMVAAIMINFGAKDPDMLTILILYSISGFGLAYTSYMRKTPWMVVLMTFYTIVSFVGIYKLI